MSRQRLAAFLACLAAGLVAGCATQSHVPASDAETRELRIKAGDEIRVITTRRERIGVRVTEVHTDRFTGVTLRPRRKESLPEGQPVELPFEELALVEVTRATKESVAKGALGAVVAFAATSLVIDSIIVAPMTSAPVP